MSNSAPMVHYPRPTAGRRFRRALAWWVCGVLVLVVTVFGMKGVPIEDASVWSFLFFTGSGLSGLICTAVGFWQLAQGGVEGLERLFVSFFGLLLAIKRRLGPPPEIEYVCEPAKPEEVVIHLQPKKFMGI